MERKRITEIFPFLIPIRIWQRNLFSRIGMFFDKNTYAKQRGKELSFVVVENKTVMINENSGQDIIYQKNKVDNLKIMSKTMHQIYIKPKETFSFCYLARKSRKYGKMKKGLVLVNNKIVPKVGGGICHLSNLLYESFLMTPLTIVERHGHKIKSFPNPDKNSLEGVDATIHSGWLDLQVRNDTLDTYQIFITFDEEFMYVKILSDKESAYDVSLENEDFQYIQRGDVICESVGVVKVLKDKKTKKVVERIRLYEEIVEVGYDLPKDTVIEEIC